MVNGNGLVDILLVEDHKELNELVRTFLERDGYVVKSVFSGEEATLFMSENKAKLVLLDVMLPGCDGFAICSAIRKESNIPIIFICIYFHISI